jgi:hypothetical protein
MSCPFLQSSLTSARTHLYDQVRELPTPCGVAVNIAAILPNLGAWLEYVFPDCNLN